MGPFQALSAFLCRRQHRETFMKNLATPDVYKFCLEQWDFLTLAKYSGPYMLQESFAKFSLIHNMPLLSAILFDILFNFRFT